MKDTKRLELETSTFEANGVKYFINPRLSLNRWIAFEKLQPKLGFGKDFDAIYNNLKTSIDYANKGKGIEAWNIILNLKESIADKLENRMDTALHICALFINRENEDIDKVDEILFEAKISDWKAEGYDAVDFFHLAANLVQGFVAALSETSQSTLEAQESRKK